MRGWCRIQRTTAVVTRTDKASSQAPASMIPPSPIKQAPRFYPDWAKLGGNVCCGPGTSFKAIDPALSPRGDRSCPFADNENSRWLAAVRFNPEFVVDGAPQFLLTTEVLFRGLDRFVSEQEL